MNYWTNYRCTFYPGLAFEDFLGGTAVCDAVHMYNKHADRKSPHDVAIIFLSKQNHAVISEVLHNTGRTDNFGDIVPLTTE
jgi:hypothetical protein